MNPERILIPVDIRKCPLEVFSAANGLANQPGANVTLLHVVTLNIGMPEKGVYEALARDAHAHLKRLARGCLRPGITTVTRVRFGKPAEEILTEAAAGNIDLIVLPSYPPSFLRRLFGPILPRVVERVIREAPCGVFLTSASSMITGDNPLTASAIAAEAGVDDFLAQATPRDKMDLIKKEQAGGRLVAMTGDGTNDAPALAQADVGLAMNTGTMAAKEAGNMVDLDSNPTKLIEVVAIGKQLLMTRGSLTTFSIANDIAKYFAILPAMFMATYPSLSKLNIMFLRNPQSAVLAAVIFNALIIIALIPLALRGVAYKPLSAAALLRRNVLIYGLGGILVPFPGIWLIDQLLVLVHLA